MKFARIVFIVAGIWGIVVLIPLYFLFDISGREYATPTMYPQFFYGFLAVTLAWQIAFLAIGSDPGRFRPLMIPSMIEKLGYIVTVVALYSQARISNMDASTALPDGLLLILFFAAFMKTRGRRYSAPTT
jgi:hypothetical protein